MDFASQLISRIVNEFEWSYARSSGAGGQNVNKVSSKAILRWNVRISRGLPIDVRDRFLTEFASRLTNEGELIIGSDRFRDQGRNVSDCLAKLQAMVQQVAHPPKKRKATRPTRSSVRKRVEGKKIQGERKRAREKVRY